MAIRLTDSYPMGSRPTSTTVSSIGTIPTGLSTVTQTNKVIGGIYATTTLTLASLAQTVVNGTDYVGTKIWTFPQGRILIFDVVASLAQTTTSALATTLNASSTGALSLGSAAASSTTLATTMANFLPSTAFTSSATINVAGATVDAELDANGDYSEHFILDGSSTAVPMYLNSAYATDLDLDGDATQTWSGTIVIDWMLLSYTQGLAN